MGLLPNWYRHCFLRKRVPSKEAEMLQSVAGVLNCVVGRGLLETIKPKAIQYRGNLRGSSWDCNEQNLLLG